jgi:hypothetical protein
VGVRLSHQRQQVASGGLADLDGLAPGVGAIDQVERHLVVTDQRA